MKIRRKNVRKKQKVLWKLFLSTLYLSAFTFGGGYVIVTLMKDKFVDKYHWIEENEMLDLIAIAQSAPGAIAVNGAIVVGYKLAGLAGVLTAIFGTVLPPFLIISVISVFYQMFCDNFIISQLLDGMQAGVGAVIASVVWDMAAGITKKKEWTSIVIMAAAFIASYVMEVPVVYIVLICIAMGVIRTVLAGRGGTEEMIYLQLFFSFLQIGMFSFGGGYAAMPLIREQVVSRHGWLDMGEFTNLITISQMTPGPIAINSATFVGTKIAGIPGAVVSTFGCILPSCILVTLLAWLYLKYQKMDLLQSVLQSLRPAVVAMIASAGVSILVSAFWNGADVIALADTRWVMVGIFVICLILLRKTKWNPVLVMALAGVLKLLTAIAGIG